MLIHIKLRKSVRGKWYSICHLKQQFSDSFTKLNSREYLSKESVFSPFLDHVTGQKNGQWQTSIRPTEKKRGQLIKLIVKGNKFPQILIEMTAAQTF